MLSRRIARRLAAWAAIAGLATPAVTLALPGLREQTYGDIEFISGGVGERERQAMTNISNAYNVFDHSSAAPQGGVHVHRRR